jgi:hypothetical protein
LCGFPCYRQSDRGCEVQPVGQRCVSAGESLFAVRAGRRADPPDDAVADGDIGDPVLAKPRDGQWHLGQVQHLRSAELIKMVAYMMCLSRRGATADR